MFVFVGRRRRGPFWDWHMYRDHEDGSVGSLRKRRPGPHTEPLQKIVCTREGRRSGRVGGR